MILVPQCFSCKHFDRGQPRGDYLCAAFPAGIPQPILYGDRLHTTMYPGDRGIRYEPDDSPAPPPPADPGDGFEF